MTKSKFDIVVNRYLFFRQKSGPTLRFRERFPACTELEHTVCNCTSAVSDRPPGEPELVQQTITVICRERPFRQEMGLRHPNVSIRWQEPYEDRERTSRYDEAYFNFRPDSMHVGIDLPGYGRTGCFLGNLYRGNKVDISTLMNGHSPSRIIKLNEIAEDELWVHECSWGHEAMRCLGPDPETDVWRSKLDMADLIRTTSAQYCDDTKSSVSKLHEKVSSEPFLLDEIECLQSFLVAIIRNLRNTTLFKLVSEVDEEVIQAIKNDVNEEG